MPFYPLLLRLSSALLSLSIVLTTYLYLYPLFHRCSFPSPRSTQDIFQNCTFEDEILQAYYANPKLAPFRLLALGDPQLEGDTSLPSEVEYQFPGFQQIRSDLYGGNASDAFNRLRLGARDVYSEVSWGLKYVRKQIDLIGNDYYLAHQYRTLHWWTTPTHVTVLGDLLGSQWIGDEEFERRSSRFWSRVFKGASALPPGLLQEHKEETEEDSRERRVEILGSSPQWRNRIINVAGNHDIGYAGDIEEDRITRFEAQFGPVNGDIHFILPTQQCGLINATTASDITLIPTLRVIVLNSMNLDTPALSQDLQSTTYKFVNSLIGASSPVESHTTATILLTHIPLHKEEGTCVDAPYFSFFPDDEGGGVKEQNMISADLSRQAILHGIFGKSADVEAPARGIGRDGIVLTGHDHEGCDVYHFVNRSANEWTAKRWGSDEALTMLGEEDVPGLREVTVRSMMGEFGGYAALVAAWWDAEEGRWKIEVERCSLGVQHVWWAVHILNLVTALVVVTTAAVYGVETWADITVTRKAKNRARPRRKAQEKDVKSTGSVGQHGSSGYGRLDPKRKPAVKLKQQR